jgi:hypothetical protein
VYALSKQIDVSRIPILNSAVLSYKTGVAANPTESNYMLAWRTYINEYARVSTTATGGGVTSDEARREIEASIPKSNTPEMIQANMRQSVLEMKHREYGFDKQSQSIYDRWGGRAGFEAKLPTEKDIYDIFDSPTPQVTPGAPTPIPGRGAPLTYEELKKKKKW